MLKNTYGATSEQNAQKEFHLPKLLKYAELTLSVLDGVQQSIKDGDLDSKRIRRQKVRIEVFYDQVKSMKKLMFQTTLEKILKGAVDFFRYLYKISKSNVSNEILLSCHVRLTSLHEMLREFISIATKQVGDDEANKKDSENNENSGGEDSLADKLQYDQLEKLLNAAEDACSTLEELTGFSRLDPNNVRPLKVAIADSYKDVEKMEPFYYQRDLVKILKPSLEFCNNLFQDSMNFTGKPKVEDYITDMKKLEDKLRNFILRASMQKKAMDRKKKPLKIKNEKIEKVTSVNIAQREVDQHRVKMTETYYKLQQARGDVDEKYCDIQEVTMKLRTYDCAVSL